MREKMRAEPPRFLRGALADLMRLDQVWGRAAAAAGGGRGLVTVDGIGFPHDKPLIKVANTVKISGRRDKRGKSSQICVRHQQDNVWGCLVENKGNEKRQKTIT